MLKCRGIVENHSTLLSVPPLFFSVVVLAELFVLFFFFGQVAMGTDESVHVQRHLTGDDDGRGMGPTPTTTYDGWDDPSTGDQGLVADTEEEGTYKHIGCFSDSKEDRVLGHMIWADDMTAKVYQHKLNHVFW